MHNKYIDIIEKPHRKANEEINPEVTVGDTVDVHCKIKEGDKERVQIFSGTVLQFNGRGVTRTFTVRRIVNNEGVERIFPVHSPNVIKVVKKRGGKARRAKLFYLRDRVGKGTRLAEETTVAVKAAREAKKAKKAEKAAAAAAE